MKQPVTHSATGRDFRRLGRSTKTPPQAPGRALIALEVEGLGRGLLLEVLSFVAEPQHSPRLEIGVPAVASENEDGL